MANTIIGGVPTTPVTGDKTLAELVLRWRQKLDDLTEPYLWSDQELTDYANRAINLMCQQMPIIEDSTTASICQISVLTGEHTFSISDRIVYIKRAKMAGGTNTLQFASVEEMDQTFSAWESASNGEPWVLITTGLGSKKVRLYPPSDSSDTLKLTVVRLPVYDMLYATDHSAAPEFPAKLCDKLDNAVMHYAYLKQDADAGDLKKAMQHLAFWERDIEEVRRLMLHSSSREMTAQPHGAFL